MIVRLRTVDVPAAARARYLDWINEGRAVGSHPITRYEIVAGYVNLRGLAALPDQYPPATEEDQP